MGEPYTFGVVLSTGAVVPAPRSLDDVDPLQWLWNLKKRERWVVEENARIDAEEAAASLQAALIKHGETREAAPEPTLEQPDEPSEA